METVQKKKEDTSASSLSIWFSPSDWADLWGNVTKATGRGQQEKFQIVSGGCERLSGATGKSAAPEGAASLTGRIARHEDMFISGKITMAPKG